MPFNKQFIFSLGKISSIKIFSKNQQASILNCRVLPILCDSVKGKKYRKWRGSHPICGFRFRVLGCWLGLLAGVVGWGEYGDGESSIPGF